MFEWVGLAALSGCGVETKSTTSTTSSSGACLSNGTSSSIDSNHGHTLTVSVADIQAGVDKSYSIAGTAGHDHTVTLTASHFTSLSQSTSVQVTSSLNGHTHTVTVSCA